MGAEARKPESVSSIVGFALGMASALAVFTLPVLDEAMLEQAKRSSTRQVVATVFAACAVVGLAALPRLRRSPYVVIAMSAFLPIAVSTSMASSIGLETDAARGVRGLGILLGFAACFAAAIWFARFKRELDRELLTR